MRIKATIKTITLALALTLIGSPMTVYAADATGTEIAATDGPRIRVQAGTLVIEVNGDASCHVVIYALTGQVIKQLDAAPGITHVDLPAGYYIIRSAHSTVKVTIK